MLFRSYCSNFFCGPVPSVQATLQRDLWPLLVLFSIVTLAMGYWTALMFVRWKANRMPYTHLDIERDAYPRKPSQATPIVNTNQAVQVINPGELSMSTLAEIYRTHEIVCSFFVAVALSRRRIY